MLASLIQTLGILLTDVHENEKLIGCRITFFHPDLVHSPIPIMD